MSNLLLDEYPLIILRSLAVKIGLNEAIFLQQLHYWLLKSEHIIDNKKWVYNTYEEWRKQLPFFCIRTLKTIVAHLIKMGIVETKQLNEDKRNKTNFYTINYKVFNDACTMDVQNLHDGRGKICTMDGAISAPSSINTETTTETTSDINTPQPQVARKKVKREVVIDYSEEFEKAWCMYPHHRGDGDEKDKEDTWKKWSGLSKDISEETLCQCAYNYADECRLLSRSDEFTYKITNFYGRKAYFKKYLVKKPIKINEINNEQQFNPKFGGSARQHHAAVCGIINRLCEEGAKTT